ncbi:PD40 domain-containing protein [Winogradskyella forsetii]|uniref:PD40 domain-containing protein n=1 Tax=Winogradskyella forsetii TaxID=2686077 RepID=UPI0015BD25B9|nr:PD40 domain-containing protein [Winogradskyella forsetii]
MKFSQILSLIILVVTFSNCDTKTEGPSVSKSTTQEPVMGVQPFAENVFSQFINIRDFTINVEEDEAYFTLLSPLSELSVIMKIQRGDMNWGQPKISSFSGKYKDLEPFISPDNLRLYFASNRPTSKDSTAVKDFDIWYVERQDKTAEWSQPINLGAPINTTADEFYPSVALSNNIYFTTIKENSQSQDDIYVSKWENGTYRAPIKLDDAINSNGPEFNAFIAPDESYMLFSGWKRKDGVGSGDLYISHQKNGSWSAAKNLGKAINSKQIDYCPFVNQSTGMLYFTSRRSAVKRMDSGYLSAQSLFSEINKYENGLSRIYRVNLNKFLETDNKLRSE